MGFFREELRQGGLFKYDLRSFLNTDLASFFFFSIGLIFSRKILTNLVWRKAFLG